ncbi:MAG: DUF4124 domain-containing protein [Nitrospinales bacterium]
MKRLSWCIVLSILLTVSSPLYGGIYSWTDENGVKHFSNTAPSQDAEDVIEASENSERSDDYNKQKTVSSGISEDMKELRNSLLYYSKMEKKLTFQELVGVECLLNQIKKRKTIKELTQGEKAQVENLSSKAEEAKEGLTQQQLAQLKQAVVLINARWEQDHREELTPVELADLDKLLRSKWNKMREALSRNEIEKAVSYFSDSTKDVFRKTFSALPPEKRSQLAQDLGDIQFIKERGNTVEYDLRTTEDGKKYSYFLLFEKGYDGVWRIRSF